MTAPIRFAVYDEVRRTLLEKREIALLDVREEDPHAQAHPLFAANLPLARLELDAYTKIPRRDVPVVVFDDGEGEGEAEIAAQRLSGLGFTDVAVFKGGVSQWRASGGEVFRDVNVPSKAFGELVASELKTPLFPAEKVLGLINSKADIAIADVRRFDEYQTMSIPTGTSVPGAEIVLHVSEVAPRPETQVIVNCAGRTRSIIGAQSLINAGIPNPVAALRNGTIGWTLAGQELDHGQQRTYKNAVTPESRKKAAESARKVADRAGVRAINFSEIAGWHTQNGRSTYFFDVRTHEEYLAGHLPGFTWVPGGQLVQETEMYAPIRGARIVLADDENGVRANMSASWLAQMGWEVYVPTGIATKDWGEKGDWQPPLPPLPEVPLARAEQLAGWLDEGDSTLVLDFSPSAEFQRGHIPGAWYILRSRLAQDFGKLPSARRYVATSTDGLLARLAAKELSEIVGKNLDVFALDGGNRAWKAANRPLKTGQEPLASEPIDRYKRPYEGTDSPKEAMQAYLEWEYGLVGQLARDGTHFFHVVQVNK